ncbi:hypothetical protein [Amycolatopsis azurea]|uniref:Uncharacterized protein n=1 Tax=Amycolatopsis azurea DSM 43854 TaxID=1238180 RepID=M2QFH5_9PSEU|nr:hypothetical protein [Amycolatopsis azurea]EMD24782.1 hypothetical protein C791_5802 [Amycolatopsis azurea DSM 43854]
MKQVTWLDDRERLDIGAAARTLGLKPWQAGWYHWRRRFCSPAGSQGRRHYWYENDLFKWAASTGLRKLLRQTPLRYWSDAREKAVYGGSKQVADAVVQEWITESGVVAVFWPLGYHKGPLAHEAAALFPGADALVRIASDFGRDGPTVGTAQPGNADPEWQDFAARWGDLSRVLGRPAPYWPLSLRVPHLMKEWEPDSATVTYLPNPDIDVTPLLRMVSALTDDEPAQKVLLRLARVAQCRVTEAAYRDLEFVEEAHERVGKPMELTTMVAARPIEFPEPLEINPSDAQTGWHEILSRSDLLALECVQTVRAWDGGADFHYASTETVRPDRRYGAEWAKRLRPASEPTAYHEYLGPQGEPLVDPVSGAPVVRKSDGTLTVAVPQRLSGENGKLIEVILDEPIWVRTENGVLQVAPQHYYYGINWGYGGSGPGSLALLIHRLLDDITAPAADTIIGAPDGLDELTQLAWPLEQVLTRETLEAARQGRAYRRPTPRSKEDGA